MAQNMIGLINALFPSPDESGMGHIILANQWLCMCPDFARLKLDGKNSTIT